MTDSAHSFYLVFPVSCLPEEPERLETPTQFASAEEAVAEATCLAIYYQGIIVAKVHENEREGHKLIRTFGKVSQTLIDAFAM